MDSVQYNRRPSYGTLSLKAEDVHVWRICLDRDLSYVNTLFQTLSSDERQKGESYRFDEDRNRFVVARGTVRKILGEYLNSDPEQICFSYTRYGKPFLKQEGNTIRFNVTHSRGLALFAVACGREIGIDVEFIDKNFPVVKTAQQVFSPNECYQLQTLEPDLQAAAFFQGWTLKEAYLKAIGTGFSNPGSHYTGREIPAAPDSSLGTARLEDGRDWTFANLAVDSNYKAALAVEGKIGDIRYHQS
jgi:4'-phosphopantetheinyl transferase